MLILKSAEIPYATHYHGLFVIMYRRRSGVVDKPLTLCLGVPSSILGSSSLSDETLSHDPSPFDLSFW